MHVCMYNQVWGRLNSPGHQLLQQLLKNLVLGELHEVSVKNMKSLIYTQYDAYAIIEQSLIYTQYDA